MNNDLSVGDLAFAEDIEDEGSEDSGVTDEDEDEDGDEVDDDGVSQDSSFEAEGQSVDSVSVASTPPKAKRVSKVAATPVKKQPKQSMPSSASTPLGESIRQSTPGLSTDLDRIPDKKAILDEVPGLTGASWVPGPDEVDTGIKKKKR